MKALRSLLPYIARHRWRLVMGLTLVVASSALWSVSPWLLRSALDGMRGGAPVSHAWTMAGWMVGASIVAGVMRYGMRELLNSLSRLIEFELRNDLFNHLLSLDASYFGRTRTGEIMARLTNDLSAVRMTAGPAIMYLMSTVAGGLFALAFMLRIDVRLTILALLPMTLLPFSMVGLGRAIHRRFEAVQEHFGAMTTRVQENLSGTRIVRAYRQEAPEIARFDVMSREYEARNIRLAQLYGIMNPSFALLGGLGGVIVLGLGGSLVVRGSITVGAFVAFGLYLAMLTWPLIALGWVINLFQRGAASMARLNEILETRSTLDAATRPERLPDARGGRTIEFRRVGFQYPTREGDAPRWVLRDVSFTVAGGSTLGVVGATGSGKSTLLDLVPRVYDPTEGEILLDGVPLRALPLAVVRRELGVVPQESLLFSDTIKSNLLYGTDDSASFLDAARVAQLDQTIRDFPGGYETQLGERGINLSGGQKQRAALARALARDPSVVLLDDALSAVDTHTEAEILHGLRSALRGRTTIIASHRISAIRDADQIIVLDGGRVVEQGRHVDLMALGGRYAALLARQQVEEEVERQA